MNRTRPDMEQQADEFAAELLMPEHVIRRELTATALGWFDESRGSSPIVDRILVHMPSY
ncbi:ImmA/IrrE family metallo-endopeptidase [Nocardia abscessus]|uniref:ImmA/IrrE family metallo-endopeptidase n=1 Tax=Nocardia abscessus TaxID=120957 RepID=UPI00313CEDBB